MTDKTDLLPMPKGEAVGMYQAWSYDQMRDYARANVAHAAAALHAEVEALRAEVDRLRKALDRAWNDGFDFAMKSCGWQEGEDPANEWLHVVRDSRGNVEVGMWYAKTMNSRPAEWTREFRDVDRDDIVAWMAIPDWRTARNAYKLADAALAYEDRND